MASSKIHHGPQRGSYKWLNSTYLCWALTATLLFSHIFFFVCDQLLTKLSAFQFIGYCLVLQGAKHCQFHLKAKEPATETTAQGVFTSLRRQPQANDDRDNPLCSQHHTVSLDMKKCTHSRLSSRLHYLAGTPQTHIPSMPLPKENN